MVREVKLRQVGGSVGATLPKDMVDRLHLDQLREHGGLAGIWDESALEAALARPRQKRNFEPATSIVELAAAYGFGLSRGHPYNDGNNRVSFVVMAVFLELNGWCLTATEADVVEAMVALAAGSLSEADLAAWLGERLQAPSSAAARPREPTSEPSPPGAVGTSPSSPR